MLITFRFLYDSAESIWVTPKRTFSDTFEISRNGKQIRWNWMFFGNTLRCRCRLCVTSRETMGRLVGRTGGCVLYFLWTHSILFFSPDWIFAKWFRRRRKQHYSNYKLGQKNEILTMIHSQKCNQLWATNELDFIKIKISWHFSEKKNSNLTLIQVDVEPRVKEKKLIERRKNKHNGKCTKRDNSNSV